MSILEKFNNELKEALKQKDEIKLSVVRMIKASLKNKEIEKMSTLTETDVINILSMMVKQRKEASEQFKSAGRLDLSQKEEKEIEIIHKYLPTQLSEEELNQIIISAINQTSAVSMNDVGKVMKIVISQIKGKADGKLVNKKVQDFLSSK